jgi:L-threonylcarbamoyladenylate synthase
MTEKHSHILPIDPARPDGCVIATAAQSMHEGCVVVFPTGTFYGLGVRAFDHRAVSRVFEIKKRDPRKPLLVIIASESELPALVRAVPPVAQQLMKAFWPGKVTLVFDALPVVPENLTGGTGKIGVRLAGHPVSRALAQTCGYPITATSANLSGKGGCIRIDELDDGLKDAVDYILDAGSLPGTVGSTVVDVTVFPPRILREGVVSAKEVEEVCGCI